MPKSTLALKSSVTRRKAAPVPPDMAERLEQLRHHQAASAGASTSEPKARDPEKPPTNREPNQLQQQFLSANLNRSVSIFLLNGVKLTGTLRQFDQYCVLIEGPDGVNSLTFKHAISTIAPGS